jgi:hypothetical protein
MLKWKCVTSRTKLPQSKTFLAVYKDHVVFAHKEDQIMPFYTIDNAVFTNANWTCTTTQSELSYYIEIPDIPK